MACPCESAAARLVTETRVCMLLLLVLAVVCRMLIGAAAERAGIDAWFGANPVKRRVQSIFRPGLYVCLLSARCAR